MCGALIWYYISHTHTHCMCTHTTHMRTPHHAHMHTLHTHTHAHTRTHTCTNTHTHTHTHTHTSSRKCTEQGRESEDHYVPGDHPGEGGSSTHHHRHPHPTPGVAGTAAADEPPEDGTILPDPHLSPGQPLGLSGVCGGGMEVGVVKATGCASGEGG